MMTIPYSYVRGLILLLMMAMLISCDRDEPSTRAGVDFSMKLFSNAAIQGKITFESASIRLTQVDIAATTGGLEVLSFRESQSAENIINLIGSGTTDVLNIPAKTGTYNPFQINLHLAQSSYALQYITDENNVSYPDFAHFLANAKPGIVLTGIFYNRGQTIPVYLAIQDVPIITVNAKQVNSPSISLSNENRADVAFDPGYWFQNITTLMMEGAQIIMYEGEPIIFIHPEYNRDLYQSILNRIEDGGNGTRVNITPVRKDM